MSGRYSYNKKPGVGRGVTGNSRQDQRQPSTQRYPSTQKTGVGRGATGHSQQHQKQSSTHTKAPYGSTAASTGATGVAGSASSQHHTDEYGAHGPVVSGAVSGKAEQGMVYYNYSSFWKVYDTLLQKAEQQRNELYRKNQKLDQFGEKLKELERYEEMQWQDETIGRRDPSLQANIQWYQKELTEQALVLTTAFEGDKKAEAKKLREQLDQEREEAKEKIIDLEKKLQVEVDRVIDHATENSKRSKGSVNLNDLIRPDVIGSWYSKIESGSRFDLLVVMDGNGSKEDLKQCSNTFMDIYETTKKKLVSDVFDLKSDDLIVDMKRSFRNVDPESLFMKTLVEALGREYREKKKLPDTKEWNNYINDCVSISWAMQMLAKPYMPQVVDGKLDKQKDRVFSECQRHENPLVDFHIWPRLVLEESPDVVVAQGIVYTKSGGSIKAGADTSRSDDQSVANAIVKVDPKSTAGKPDTIRSTGDASAAADYQDMRGTPGGGAGPIKTGVDTSHSDDQSVINAIVRLHQGSKPGEPLNTQSAGMVQKTTGAPQEQPPSEHGSLQTGQGCSDKPSHGSYQVAKW